MYFIYSWLLNIMVYYISWFVQNFSIKDVDSIEWLIIYQMESMCSCHCLPYYWQIKEYTE